MLIGRTTAAVVAAMIACAGTGAAQQSSAPSDSVSRAEIRTALRAFYHNRGHGNSLRRDRVHGRSVSHDPSGGAVAIR